MGVPAQNYHIGRSNNAKRAEIPFSINTGAATAFATFIGQVDDEFGDSVELFLAGATGSGNDGLINGFGGSAASALDPSANNAFNKAFPALLSADTGPTSIGFVVLDGSQKPPSTIPLPGSSPNPTYGTPQVIGDAKKLIQAEVVITDGPAASCPPGSLGVAPRAYVLTAGVTPNGNLKVFIQMQLYAGTGTGANASPIFKPASAAAVIRGVLYLSWI